MAPVALIVDDEAASRRYLSLLMVAVGFETQSASSVASACQMVHGLPTGSLVVCDMLLGDRTGEEVRRYVLECRSDLAMLMVSGSVASLINLDFRVFGKAGDPGALQERALSEVERARERRLVRAAS